MRSYARRGSRLSATQQEAWDRYAAAWLVPAATVVDAGELDRRRWFSRDPGPDRPLVVEVGSGVGEAVVALAASRPAYDVLALEVWRPGVASTFEQLARAGVTNVRVLALDAVWALEHLLAPGSVAELWTFFPDPWPKSRHHKRRLVGAPFAALAASRLQPGGPWRLATDWPDYAEQMREVLDAEPLLEGGVTDRWQDRPLTRFERRGLRNGREVADLCYRRTTSAGSAG